LVEGNRSKGLLSASGEKASKGEKLESEGEGDSKNDVISRLGGQGGGFKTLNRPIAKKKNRADNSRKRNQDHGARRLKDCDFIRLVLKGETVGGGGGEKGGVGLNFF